jgi:hypothetical protein
MIDDGAEIGHAGIGIDEGRILIARLVHFGRTAGQAISPHVERENVEALAGQIIEKGYAVERHVIEAARREGRAMDEDDRSLGGEGGQCRGPLVPISRPPHPVASAAVR